MNSRDDLVAWWRDRMRPRDHEADYRFVRILSPLGEDLGWLDEVFARVERGPRGARPFDPEHPSSGLSSAHDEWSCFLVHEGHVTGVVRPHAAPIALPSVPLASTWFRVPVEVDADRCRWFLFYEGGTGLRTVVEDARQANVNVVHDV